MIFKNKIGAVNPQLFLIFGILASSITVLGFLGVIDTASILGITDKVYTVDYGSYWCKEASVEQTITKYVNQDYVFTCGDKTLVDGCAIEIKCGNTPLLSPKCDGSYRVNDGNWISYSVNEGARVPLTNLNAGQKIEFAQKTVISGAYVQIPSNRDVTQVLYSYNPYRLSFDESGYRGFANSNDCCLVNQDSLNKNNVPYGEWDCLGKDEYRNYFLNWVEVLGAKIYSYNGQDVICRTNALYKLDTEQVATGEIRNIQGAKIKNVECCPHQDDNCDTNFEFVGAGDEVTQTCSYDYQCQNAGDPYFPLASATAVEWNCVSGTCVSNTVATECNSDARCRELYGDNYVCSFAQYNFGKCVESVIGQSFCGNNICETGETKTNCPSDCELDCLENQKIVTTESKKNCLVGFPIYAGCDTVVEKECKPIFNWFKWILIGLGVIVLFTFRRQIFQFIRSLLSKIGVRI